MKSSDVLAIVVACALRDCGKDYSTTTNDIMDARSPDVAALEAMNAAGLSIEEAIAVFREYERLAAIYPASKPVGKYQRAPRTKLYGPAQDPDTYWSAEKFKAYNYAAAFVEGEPVARLSDKDWWPLVGAVLRRDGHTCTYCGAGSDYALQCDHIVPVSRGGPNEMDNLTTACDYCNCSKRDALPHEWRPIRVVPQ